MGIVIGLIEKIKINDREIEAKIDTGASTSSIDSTLAEELNLGPTIKTKNIKSVHGNSMRPVIKTRIILQGKILNARFNLIDRKNMKYRILIGKNILKRGFIIDPKR